MVTTREGAEITIDEEEAWTGLVVEPGQVLEVFMGGTSHPVVADVWAAFFVVDVALDIDGSSMVRAFFMGSEDEELSTDLGKELGKDPAGIHLCSGRPCLDTREEARLHVTRVRVWTWENFRTTDYLGKDVAAKIKKWAKEIKKPADKGPDRLKASSKKGARKPAMRATPAKKVDKPPPVGSGLTAEMKESLRAKLRDVRKRTHGIDGPGDDQEDPNAKDKGPELVADTSEESSGYVPTPPGEREALGTGTVLPPHSLVALENPGRGHSSGATKKVKGATKDITSKSLSGQLILRAVEMTKARKTQVKKKSKKKSSGEKVAQLLSKILTKGSRDKKKKKEKRSKRKVVDGVIISCSSSSKSDCETEEIEEESSTDLEAPIKKRSRDRPGSVLALLTDHVRDQMDQASLAEMPSDTHRVTDGVKISSYFALHIKPNFHQNLRELREMHSLGATLDLLCKGDIARVGDSLAARFMALHQSMLDQNWSTARFMELHSMDEGGSTAPSLLLASRKHSRLVDKVQGKGGPTWGNWYHRGAGKGRGGWKGSGDWVPDAKGGKGKDGKKGKGKGGYKGQGQGWDKKVNEWKDQKEKPDEK